MDSGVAAAVGVIAGAVVTGGVQSIGGLLSRGLTGRIAARVVYHDLSAAHSSIRRAQDAGSCRVDLDPQSARATWAAQREPLARALRTVDFVKVANAFEAIQLVSSENKRHRAGAERETPCDAMLEKAVTTVDAGRAAALRECFSPWERLTRASRDGVPDPVRLETCHNTAV
jgi:hypothetical protein